MNEKSQASPVADPDQPPITIKKYANRRLYNTATSCYVTLDYLSLIRKIEWHDWNLLEVNILPNIQLGPIAKREYPKLLSNMLFPVKQIPKLWTLVFWIPLSKFITVREKPLLCPGLFLIPSATPQGCIKFKFLNGIQQGTGLKHVSACIYTGFFNYLPLIDCIP